MINITKEQMFHLIRILVFSLVHVKFSKVAADLSLTKSCFPINFYSSNLETLCVGG